MFEVLGKAASTGVQGAVMVLLICTAFGMILRGPRGARWVIATAFSPLRDLLARKVSGVLYLCGYVIVSYLVGGLMHPSGR
jgi:hypothetical protein